MTCLRTNTRIGGAETHGGSHRCVGGLQILNGGFLERLERSALSEQLEVLQVLKSALRVHLSLRRSLGPHENQERVHGRHDFGRFHLLIVLLQPPKKLVEQLLSVSPSPGCYGHNLFVHLELLPRRNGVTKQVDFGHKRAERLVSQQLMDAKPFRIGGFHRIHRIDKRFRRLFYRSFLGPTSTVSTFQLHLDVRSPDDEHGIHHHLVQQHGENGIAQLRELSFHAKHHDRSPALQIAQHVFQNSIIVRQ